jgi:hypothetical protein
MDPVRAYADSQDPRVSGTETGERERRAPVSSSSPAIASLATERAPTGSPWPLASPELKAWTLPNPNYDGHEGGGSVVVHGGAPVNLDR